MTTEVQWRLVSQSGTEFPLPQTMIFLGREECDVTLQSRSVDKRHAVITYDHYEKRFKVKDLNSVNGTYVNDTRIPEQSYVKLEHLDNLRFGYDPTVYSIHSSLHSPQQVSPDTGMATLDAHLPNWTARDYAVANSMAECQGCLHEQAIQHTCGGMRDSNNAKSSVPYAKGVVGTAVTSNSFHSGGGSGTTSPSLTDFCGNMVHLNAGGGMATYHSVHTGLTTSSASTTSTSYTHQQYSQQQSVGNTPFHNVILPTGASGQGLPTPPAHPSVPGTTTYAQPGGASSSSGVSAFTTAPTAAGGAEGASVAHHRPSLANSVIVIEGRVQALATSNLASAKQKPEATSSNNSLYSAFSGDSLDQLGGEGSQPDQGCGDQQQRHSQKVGASASKDLREDSNADNASSIGKSSKRSANRAKKESSDSPEVCKAEPSPFVAVQSLPVQETLSRSSLHSAPASPDELKAKQKGLVTAFTIDFDDVKKTPTSKKLDIKDSISKFAPPKAEGERPTHRRNHSLGKVEASKEDKERPENISPEQSSEKGFYSPKRVSGLRRGYHSEGYFSSDQDDDLSARSELGAHKSKRLEKDLMKNGAVLQHMSHVVDKNPPNKKGDGGALNSSAAFLIDKMFNATSVKAPPPSPKKSSELSKKSSELSVKSTTSSVRTEGRMPSPPSTAGSAVRPSVLNVNSSFTPSAEATVAVIKSSSRNGVNNNSRNGSDDDAKDNVSESGTYTIDKESPSLELQEARRNIDKVFGITPEEPEEAVITGPRGIVQEMMDSPASSSSNSKSDSKRGTPTWLREWAATSVTHSQHSPSPDREGSRQSPVTTVAINHKGMREVISITQGQAPPPSPMSSSNGLVTMKFPLAEGQPRPRRKLPTPPVDKPPFSLASSRTSDLSDLDTSCRDRTNSPSASDKFSSRSVCAQSPNDNSYDTEKLLRDTENVVYAMEARIDQRSRTFAHGMGSSVESSRDSGGESDVDTSTASYCNESKTHKHDKNVSKRLASQLKSKYQLMDESGHHAPRMSQPAAPSPSSSSRLGSRSRSLTIENENAANSDNVSEYETASVASDVSSSSDISGSSPRTRRKNSDKTAPALKFNRAFSLRRARLGYLSDGPSEKSKSTYSTSSHPPPVPKGKNLETKRSRPTTSASSGGTSLSRNDGGRFSLRVAKNSKGGPAPPSSKTDSSEVAAKCKPRPHSSVTASRSNSTLSNKEAELKNWRRRKEYDPMKAAAEGRRKDVVKRTNQQRPGRTPTPPNSANNFQRSASFHGTEGLHRFRRNTFTSEDDVARSLDDEEELAISASNSSVHLDSDLPSELSEISLVQVNSQVSDISCRMTSEEYVLEEVRPAPIGRSGPATVSHRHSKHKLEALDNLVITTIHQLSSKLCNHTQSVLRRLREQYQGNIEKSQSLEDLMELLGLPDTPTSPSTRTMSRDLSGTLKNLKKLEKCIQVIERVVAADSEIPTDCMVQECTVINGKASTRQKCNGLPDGEYF